MKNIKKLGWVGIFFFLCSTLSSHAMNSFPSSFVANDLVGEWNYTVPNAPYEYSKGVMIISKVEEAFAVTIQVNGSTLQGEEVVVNGNEISFKVSIEGAPIDVTLSAEGDKIFGQSVSPEGTLEIEGSKAAE